MVTTTTFTVAAPLSPDQFVGGVTATNTPTSWALGNDTNHNFAIYPQTDGSANLRISDGTSAGGGGGPPPDAGTYFLVAKATNASATGTGPSTVTVTAAPPPPPPPPGGGNLPPDDGLANAPPGAAPFANALALAPAIAQPQNKTYVKRPGWHVPGVDYNVGPRVVATKDVMTAVNGTSVRLVSTGHISLSGATPLVFDGFDFTIGGLQPNGGGYYFDITATNVTFRNCKFGWNFGGQNGNQIWWGSPGNTLLIEYCLFDHRGWLAYGNGQGAGGYVFNLNGQTQPNPQNLTLHYNWFRGTPNHIVTSTVTPTGGVPIHLEWMFNVVSEGGQAAPWGGSHFNTTEWGGIPPGSTAKWINNFYLYVPINGDNETIQTYANSPSAGGAASNAEIGWNVFIGPNTNPAAYGFFGSTPVDQTTWTTLNYPINAAGTGGSDFWTVVHDNFMDKSGYPPDSGRDMARGGARQTFQANNYYLITGAVIPR